MDEIHAFHIVNDKLPNCSLEWWWNLLLRNNVVV